MSKDVSNTRATLSSVLGFMNQPIKYKKDNKDNDVKAINKTQKVEIVKDEHLTLAADSYLVVEISHEDIECYSTQSDVTPPDTEVLQTVEVKNE